MQRDRPIEIGRALRLDRRAALELLRDLARDRAVLASLRALWAREAGRSATCFAGDAEVLGQLAQRVASGELIVARVQPPLAKAGPPGAAINAGMDLALKLKMGLGGLGDLLPAIDLNLPDLAGLLPPWLVALIELIESVEIEAVDVRVEVEQAMAVLKMAQARFDLGVASLQEIPASIDRVATSMKEVASDIQKSIEEL